MHTNDKILEKINFLYTYNEPNKNKFKKSNKSNNKRRQKWYDQSCYEMNRKMKSIAIVNQKYPGNHTIRK